MKQVIRLMLLLLALLPATIANGQNENRIHHAEHPFMPTAGHHTMNNQAMVMKTNTLTHQLIAPMTKGTTKALEANQSLLNKAFNSSGNNLMNKAPRRLSADDFTGEKILFWLAYEYNYNLDEIVMNDDYLMGGWNVSITEESDGVLSLTDLYYGYPVTINVDYNAKTAEMVMGTLATLQWSNTVGPTRYDTTELIMIVNEDYLFNGNLTNISGSLNDNGSMYFPDGFCYYIIDYCKRTRSNYVTYDTVAMITSFFHETYLMTPNGKHEFLMQSFDSGYEKDSVSVDVYMYQADDTTAIIWNMWGLANRDMMMYIHEDGTMEFPSLQVVCTQDTAYKHYMYPYWWFHNEMYNISIDLDNEADTAIYDTKNFGSKFGTVTPTVINWDASLIFTNFWDEYGSAGEEFLQPLLHNKLTFTDGSHWFENQQGPIEDNIVFADNNVKALCVQNWDTGGDGELSYTEAAAVTDLGSVFRYNSTITSFDELQHFTGLTSICDSAFYYCWKLSSIILPNTITTIGSSAFSYCQRMTSIEIPNSVALIGDRAFMFCTELTKALIGNSLTSFGDVAFGYCYKLVNCNIPNSVTSIGMGAFYGCSSLTSITIGNSVTSISNSAFGDCSSLTSLVVANDNPNYDSRNNCNAIIETASNKMIFGCQNTVILNTVTAIAPGAFSGCTGLTSIEIPNSVISIASNSFIDCSGLTSIVVANGNPNYDSRNNCNAIIKTVSNELITGCKNTVIPNTVTVITSYAFRNCQFTSIDIPNSVTTIGNQAFSASWLNSIDIPSSVTSIDDNAFWSCTHMTRATIPNSVTFIGGGAFGYCTNLTDVYCYISNLSNVRTGSDLFYLNSQGYSGRTLHVPAGALTAYQEDTKWSQYFGNIVEMVQAGDVNGDDILNVTDVTLLINLLLNEGGQIIDNAAADVNGDGIVNVTDVIAFINILLDAN